MTLGADTLTELLVVALASGLAGLVDAIVGGGGLVLIPALFSTFPSAAPATLFGTNKSASVWGTAMAAWQYGRRVKIDLALVGPGIAAALAGSFSGAWAVTVVDGSLLRKALPFVLLAVLAYTLARKNLGRDHQPLADRRRALRLLLVIALGVGFYDGFFGPGTGSFLIFLLVRLLGYDFLHASATAKCLNVATNGAALLLFALKGHVWWQLGGVMALTNIAGGLLGARLALRHGAGFVRGVFLVVVSALIAKTAYDAFLR
ncbi:MAG: hypothetical protein RL722_1841 [Pseudomonadota bacterium]|jgi:uncharacterized membrane protein YfcA